MGEHIPTQFLRAGEHFYYQKQIKTLQEKKSTE